MLVKHIGTSTADHLLCYVIPDVYMKGRCSFIFICKLMLYSLNYIYIINLQHVF